MQESLRKIREERHRQYQQLSADQRPHVEPCSHCHEPPYQHEVCPVSGLFHDLDKKRLVGGQLVTSRTMESSDLLRAIDLTRVRWVPRRTELVKADSSSLNIFQTFATQMGWNLQRYGILYGRYDASTHTVEVHAVYEPEQHSNAYTFEVVEDPKLPTVDLIAKELGLRRVGAICTQPERNTEAVVLSHRELLLCAKEQSRFGDECVLLTIAPKTTDGTRVLECHAWQASPQAVHFFRLGVLKEPCMEPATLWGEADRINYVESTVPLEVAQERTDSKGHQSCIIKEANTHVETRWFTSYTAVEQFESQVVTSLFMRQRPGLPPPTWKNLRIFMEDPKRKQLNFAAKLADFHVLVFLSDYFSAKDDLPILCQMALSKSGGPQAESYHAIISAMMDQS